MDSKQTNGNSDKNELPSVGLYKQACYDLKNEPINTIIKCIREKYNDKVYHRSVFSVILERKDEIDNKTFLELSGYLGDYNLDDLNPLYEEFIRRNLEDDLVSLINNLIKEKCNKYIKDIRYIKQSIKDDLTIEAKLFDSEVEGSIPFFYVGNGELSFSDVWEKYILNIEENPIIKEILLGNPIMLNRLSSNSNSMFSHFSKDPYKQKMSLLLSREDFHWDEFNEIADKVSDYSIKGFLDCVPQNRKNYIVSYMCECDNEIRYRYLLRRYFTMRDVPSFSPEERKKMLTRGKEDGSWLLGEATKYISYPNFPVELLCDDIKKFGTPEITKRFLNNERLSYKDAIGIIIKEKDIKQRFELYTIKQGYLPIIKYPDLFSLTFEDNTFTAPNSLGGPLINRSRELNKFKFKQIIIKLIYDCNFTDGEKLTISDFLERVKPWTRNINKGNQIRDDMKEVLKEVIEELNDIGIRIRKEDNSLVKVEKTIDEEENQIL